MGVSRSQFLFFVSIVGPSLWYSFPWIKVSGLLFFALYIFLIALISLWTPQVKHVDLRRLKSLMILIIIGYLGMSILYFDQKYLPNLLITSVMERINKSPMFPIYLRSLVAFASLYLMYNNKGLVRAVSLIAFIMLYFTSGSTSRGSLLILFGGILPLLESKRIRSLVLVSSIILGLIYFNYVADLRGAASALAFDKLEWNFYGHQTDPLKALFFFVPGFLKGEWVATNILLSMQVLPLNQYFYVYTFGDFANGYFGYGILFLFFWSLFAIYLRTLFCLF
ncbi:MAG: hypothetical protein ACJ0QP_05275 [Schleiferiaceae bacterium]